MTDKQFLHLLNEMTLMRTLPESLAKKIDKIFYKLDVLSPDIQALEDKVEGLSDNAESALVDAIKDEDVARILNILGMKPSTKRGII